MPQNEAKTMKRIPLKVRLVIAMTIFTFCFTMVFGIIDYSYGYSIWKGVLHSCYAVIGLWLALALFNWVVGDGNE